MSVKDKLNKAANEWGKWVILAFALAGIITIGVLSFTLPYC